MRIKPGLAGVSVGSLVFLSACGGGGQGGNAEDYPSEDISLVIPYGPGGATDVTFRTLIPGLQDEVGVNITPVNMAGASATAGSREVLNADPDGYTLLGSHETILATEISGVVDYTYDSFETICQVAEGPVIGVVRADAGWDSAEAFADHVRENPGEVTWGVIPGSTSHFFAQMMLDRMGLPADSVRFVSYEGTAPSLAAIQAGDLDGTMAAYADAGAQLDAGTFNSIGVAHDERLEELPDLPTFQEQDVDLVYAQIRGLFAPEGTPDEVVNTLESACESAVGTEEYQESIREAGSIPAYLSGEEYNAKLEDLHEEMQQLADDMEF